MLRFAWVAAFAGAAAAAPPAPEAVLDDFATLAPWSIEASEGVKASLAAGEGPAGAALCLDFDFGNVSGYAIARRRLPLTFPPNFELAFDLRGDAKPNALQVKLVDASGENVWWYQRPDFAFPHAWQPMRVRRREVSFAWGPSPDHALARTESLELAVARGEGGGAGRVCIDRLVLREVARAEGAPREPVVEEWESDPAEGKQATLTIDLESQREFGGLMLRWLPGRQATSYAVELSDDGAGWRTVREVTRGGGGLDPMRLPDSQARYIRVRMRDGPAKTYFLARVDVLDVAAGESANAFFQAVAREAPRGRYPRGFSGEQPYWTAVGIDGGPAQGLLSEDGSLEAHAGGAAIEPMLLEDGRLVTWAGLEATHSLAEGYLPIPTATLRHGELRLRVTAFGDGDREGAEVVARYGVENRSAAAKHVTLVLALRPFQVNPPGQFLNSPGGVASAHAVAWDGTALVIDGAARYYPLAAPDEAFAAPFQAGNLPVLLLAKSPPAARSVVDPEGFPSAALLYRLDIPAGASRSVGVVAPLAGVPTLPRGDAAAWLEEREARVATEWREKLGRVAISAPDAAKPFVDTMRSALAQVLIGRAGPALQPGTRAYARSWIRDGALMSDALLRMGHPAAVREFADWFAPHLFASGKVPCCVDARGADPVAENDSHGEWIHLVDAYYGYTRDKPWLAAKWPGIVRTASYMESLRVQSRLDAPQPMFAGLMPPSISHEGYSDKPAWSYWDDFWALEGYRGAGRIAQALGRSREARAFAREGDELQRTLLRSIDASRASHHVDYIPGSADRGDFDATSTTIALSPAGGQSFLPAPWIDATFERYWREFADRRDGERKWDAYTPYELRNVGAFARLGWRERAGALLEFFMAGRRPAGWNQWAEVVGREARAPRFVGDMPHGWVASDYIRSMLDLFAFERESDRSLVLAAGLPLDWLEGPGVSIEGLRTRWGNLAYTLRREGTRTVLTLPKGNASPPGGWRLAWPLGEPPQCGRVTGASWKKGASEIRIAHAPARVVVASDANCVSSRNADASHGALGLHAR
ncbi:MAG TPA: discoidin domain-containing protein [Usitatibacter sp.]|nr:discoidin domain-containing protein [Usitatibacter sp.]